MFVYNIFSRKMMPKTSQSKTATYSRGLSRSQNTSQQPSLEQSSKSQKNIGNLNELVNNCVRYIIHRAGNNLPIRKPELQKNVLANVGRDFDMIIKHVTEELKNVYNYDLYLNDEASSTKSYLVSNALPYKRGSLDVINEDNATPKDVHKIIVILVLTHIFMSNTSVSEASIFTFLRSVNIEPDERHLLFGNVREFVISTMVKQRYISAIIEETTRKALYSWGPRAEHEISKHELLKFVCKMYKDRLPKSWTDQFEAANKQFQLEQAEANGEVEVMEDSS